MSETAHSALRATVYPFQVRYIRTHLTGALAGLSIPCKVGFPDRGSAVRWAACAEGQVGMSEVHITDAEGARA